MIILPIIDYLMKFDAKYFPFYSKKIYLFLVLSLLKVQACLLLITKEEEAHLDLLIIVQIVALVVCLKPNIYQIKSVREKE